MADTFTVEFDKSGNIVKVVDTDGNTTFYKDFVPIAKSPIPDILGVTITEVYHSSSSCYIHHGCQRVKVC